MKAVSFNADSFKQLMISQEMFHVDFMFNGRPNILYKVQI